MPGAAQALATIEQDILEARKVDPVRAGDTGEFARMLDWGAKRCNPSIFHALRLLDKNNGRISLKHVASEPADPIPLTQMVDVPPFPVAALPGVIADMVSAVAEATQTDPAMAATSALSALSACTGGRARIEIRDGWQEPLCLYSATIAAPGERKSTVQAQMIGPIYNAERQLADESRTARAAAEEELKIALKALTQPAGQGGEGETGGSRERDSGRQGRRSAGRTYRSAAHFPHCR